MSGSVSPLPWTGSKGCIYTTIDTCPFKYEPIEEFIPGIDQSTVDNSTEKWLDKIEERTDYIAWFCGHWHTNKRIDDMHFLFHKFESSKAIKEIAMAKRLTNNEIGVAIGNYNILTTIRVLSRVFSTKVVYFFCALQLNADYAF